MNGTITYEYQLVAAGMMPIWAGVLLAVAVTLLVAWLLRSELRSRKRAGTIVKILLTNRSIIAVILAILLVQPVLYINRIQTQPGQLILAADRSRSMLRVDAMDATTLLNLAAQFKVANLETRVTAGDDARRLLSTRRTALEKFRAQIAAAAADLSQGVPPSPAVESQIAAQIPDLSAISKDFAAHLAKLPSTQAPTTQPPGYVAPITLVEKAAGDLGDLAALLTSHAGKPLTQETAELLLRGYDVLLKSALAADAALAKMQLEFDQRFLAAMPADARKLVDALAQKSRFELASLVATQSSQDPQFSAAHRVVLRGFDGLDAGSAHAHTDLYDVIDHATQQGVDEVVSGLVLLSDGQQNLPERAEVLRRIPGRGIPFVAAGVGSADPIPDVAFVDFDVPAVIQRDKKTLLTAQLKTQLPADAPVNVTLNTADGQTIARATVLAGANGRAAVSLEFRLPEAGQKLLTLRAAADKPDAAPENDSVSIPLTVVGSPSRVLVIARWPRWDMVHALQALATRPTNVTTVFWGQLSKAPPRGSSSSAIPDSLENLKRYQLVVLDGSVFAGAKPEDSQLFADFVAQGGNLLVIQSEDAGYAGAWKWLGSPVNPSTSKPGVPPSVALAPGGASDGYPLVHLSADAALSRSAWAKLAPIVRHTAVAPQAVSLLIDPKGEPAMTLGFRGRGKVYLLGVADLFRTREWAGGVVASRFLGNVIDDALQPLFLASDAKAAVYPAMPVAGLEAVVLSASGEALQIKPENGTAAALTIAAPADKSITPSAFVAMPAAGKFDITSGGTSVLSSQSIRQLSMEDVDFQLDPARMTVLATAASGRYVPLTELLAALKQIPAATERTISVRQFELWNLLALLPIIAALMTLDWYLRRKAGMVL